MPSLDVAINALRAKHGANQFDAAVKRIKRGASEADVNVRRADKSIGKFSSTAKAAVGGVIGLAVAYKSLRFATSSVKEFADFEMHMANVSTMLTDATMKYMPGYEKQIKSMAREFGHATGTLSKGLYDILSASISADKAIGVLRVSSKAAVAGLTDVGTSADALTTILNSYGLEAEDATRIGDILFSTVKAGKITFGELAGSIGKVSSLSAAVGLDFTEVSAAISTMTRNGVQADIAMTALRAILATFLAPQEKAIEMASKFGLELNANTIRSIGLTGALEKLTDATEEEVAAIFSNRRALVGIAPLRNNLTALIQDQENALKNLGVQEEAYSKIADKTGTKLKRLSEDWKAVKVSFGEYLAETIYSIPAAIKAIKEVEEAEKRAGKKRRSPIGAPMPKPPDIRIPSLEFFERNRELIPKMIAELEAAGQHVPGKLRQMLEPTLEQVEQIRAELEKMAMFEDLEKKFYVSPEAEKARAVEIAKLKEEELIQEQKAAEEKERYLDDQANAYRRLYNDLDFMSESSYDNRIKLLDLERIEYERFIDDKLLLDEWYAKRKGEIDAELAIASDDFFKGFSASMEGMKYDVITWGDVGATTAQSVKNEFTNSLKMMTMAGADWRDAMEAFGQNVLTAILDIVTQMVAMKILMTAFGIGGAAGTGAGTTFTNEMAVFGAPSAKGNIFSQGRIKAFGKGDILTGPTIFPMSNGGIGLGGEAGTEAIMPLQRDASGRLGVIAEDSESKTPIKIINVMDYSQVQEYLDSGDGERQIVNIMRRNLNEIEA